MIFLKYEQPKAEYVQFQRLTLGLIVLASVFTEEIVYIHIFLALSLISFITTMNYSPTTLFFKLINFILRCPLFVTAPQYAHSYVINQLAEVFEDIMRISAGILTIYLYAYSPLSAWIMASFMGIAMLISSFFGFCLSSLIYIGYKHTYKKLKK